MSEIELEAPVADAAEQGQDAIPVPRDSDALTGRQDAPLEADRADTAEQGRELSLGDDDYR
jgi:hypothetical protein